MKCMPEAGRSKDMPRRSHSVGESSLVRQNAPPVFRFMTFHLHSLSTFLVRLLNLSAPDSSGTVFADLFGTFLRRVCLQVEIFSFFAVSWRRQRRRRMRRVFFVVTSRGRYGCAFRGSTVRMLSCLAPLKESPEKASAAARVKPKVHVCWSHTPALTPCLACPRPLRSPRLFPSPLPPALSHDVCKCTLSMPPRLQACSARFCM